MVYYVADILRLSQTKCHIPGSCLNVVGEKSLHHFDYETNFVYSFTYPLCTDLDHAEITSRV